MIGKLVGSAGFLSSGGSIGGDLTITGDLTVQGGGSLSFDEIIEGTQVIDVDSTEALLVRKDGDGGDVFIVDTTNSRVGVGVSPSYTLDLTTSSNNMARFNSSNSTGGTLRFAQGGNNKFFLGMFSSISGSGTDYSPFLLAETGLGLSFGVNGTANKVMTLDSSGNVGIGISPLATFHAKMASNVNFTTTANSTALRLNAVNDAVDATIPLEINSTNTKFLSSVGIGSTPASHTNAISASQTLSIGEDQDSSDKLANVQIIGRGANSTDDLGALEFINTRADAGVVASIVGGRYDGGSYADGSLSFKTRNGSSFTTKMTINDVGNIGIGVASPESLLHIESAENATMRIHNTTAGYAPQLLFEGNVGTNADHLLGKIDATWDGASNVVSSVRFESGADTSNKDDGIISFWTSSASSSVAERMRITSAGNVGINCSPSQDLEIKMDTDKHLLFSDSQGETGNCPTIHTVNTAGSALVEFGIRASEIRLATGSAKRMVLDDNSRISLSNNDSGVSNTVFGKLAGNAIASGGNYNLLIGEDAGNDLTTSDHNVAIGFQALSKATANLDGNTALGNYAMGSVVSNDVNNCTALGYASMSVGVLETTASGTVAVGFSALNNLTSGAGNTAIGYTALTSCTSGGSNIAIGDTALEDLVTGGANVAIGRNAGKEMGAAENGNILIGMAAGQSLDEGTNGTIDSNIAIGKDSFIGGDLNTASTAIVGNIAIGTDALNSTGTNAQTGTIAIGHEALTDLTAGAKNTAIGYQSAGNLTTGGETVIIGYQAGASSTIGNKNVLLGVYAGNTIVEDSNNTAVGYSALLNANGGGSDGSATDTNNTAIGYNSADVITTGTNNTCLGANTDPSANNASNQTVIGQGATGQADNSVTLGNADVTAVYMAQDSGATIYAGGLSVDNGTGTINRGNSTGDIFEARGLNASQMKITTSAFTVTPNATFTGSISKGSGSFKIDHPLESKKDTHYLVHSFVEAPQADNIYRGKATLSGGSIEINLDTVSGMSEGTFVLLNTDVQCFTSNESDWDAVKGSVSGNILTISCQNTDSTADVSWLVIGERQDDHIKETNWTDENGKVIVEPEKNN